MSPDPAFETVLVDDFSAYAPGAFSDIPDAVHESHFIRPAIDRGPWTETSVYHTNRNPNVDIQWVITEHGGRRVLKQTGRNLEGVLGWGNFVRQRVLGRDMCPLLFFPSLAAGSDTWTDYRVETSIIPLSDRLCGILFRSPHGLEHYIFGLERGRIRLMARRFNTLRVLASRRHRHRIGTLIELAVSLSGGTIRCAVDGREAFAVADASFPRGRCGVLANGPAAFQSFRVSMAPGDRESSARDAEARTSRRIAEQSRHPRMNLVRRVVFPVTAHGRSVRFGDLSGSGDVEALIVHAGDETRASALGLTAVDVRGRVIWQSGEVRHEPAIRIRDVPAQIHDIDGDGRSEVICYSAGRLHVLDGATGAVKSSKAGPTPAGSPSGSGPLDCDSIFICDLDGGRRAEDLLIKDVYSRIFAMDRNLDLRWQYQCKTGHYPFTFDIDGDGRDEILIGYTMLTADGTKLWSLRLNDHADAVAILKPAAGAEPIVAIAASNEGFLFADARGRTRTHLRIGHMQTITAGPLVAGSPEAQIATNTYWGNPGVIYILSLAGEILNAFQPSIHGSPLSPVRWTRDRQDFLLLSAAAGPEGGLYDWRGEQVVAFPDDGHPELCCYVSDIDGDGLEEILCWDDRELWIYRSEETGPGRSNAPIRMPAAHNQSNYRAHVTI